MMRAPLPPGARDVVTKRDHGILLNDMYVACGWASPALKQLVAPRRLSAMHPSVYDSTHAISTPETAKRYRWDWLVGLSVLLWAESPTQATILETEVAPLILAEQPLLLQLWRAYRGPHAPIEFLKLSTVREVQHAG
jgi:hypothetical protein